MCDRRSKVIPLAVVMLLSVFQSPPADGAGGGGPLPGPPPDTCIPPLQREFAQQLLADYEETYGPLSRAEPGVYPPRLTFFPLAGRLWRDLFTIYYVDLDPTSGVLDWACGDDTYDGHTGNDTDIRTFSEQLIGVPVFAAQDGVVVATHDGEEDMNTDWSGQTANFVIIDHDNGREGWYWHLKKNSIVVSVDEPVSAGQQIAKCGSSGESTGPHLHFEIRDDGQVYEPFTGACRPGSSGWVRQPSVDRSTYLHDFGITYEDVGSFPEWPYRWPTSGQIALSDPAIRVWFYGTSLPANSTWTVRFRRPNGTIVPGSTPQAFENPPWRWFSWWQTYNVTEMHSTTGTWHVLLSINGEEMVEAPVEVRSERTPGFNRPPEPITVRFDPYDPGEGEVLACQVNTSLTLDDLDYDLVRYEYVWTINGGEVRRVTTAAHSDVLASDLMHTNDEVVCSVTPNDGLTNGPGDSESVTIGEPIVPALSDWGLAVLLLLLATCGVMILKARFPGGSDSTKGF